MSNVGQTLMGILSQTLEVPFDLGQVPLHGLVQISGILLEMLLDSSPILQHGLIYVGDVTLKG
jgi:hypothetical protein